MKAQIAGWTLAFLTPCGRGGAWECAFLASPQVKLLLLAWVGQSPLNNMWAF